VAGHAQRGHLNVRLGSDQHPTGSPSHPIPRRLPLASVLCYGADKAQLFQVSGGVAGMKGGPCPTMSGGATLLSFPRGGGLDAIVVSSGNNFLANLHRIASDELTPATIFYNGQWPEKGVAVGQQWVRPLTWRVARLFLYRAPLRDTPPFPSLLTPLWPDPTHPFCSKTNRYNIVRSKQLQSDANCKWLRPAVSRGGGCHSRSRRR
jgi:hypothetical protein